MGAELRNVARPREHRTGKQLSVRSENASSVVDDKAARERLRLSQILGLDLMANRAANALFSQTGELVQAHRDAVAQEILVLHGGVALKAGVLDGSGRRGR